MEKRFIGVKEFAQYLGIKEATVYAWVSMKKIPYHKFGKLVKFDLREIDSLTARLRVGPNLEVLL